jgi:hypothetical protein
MSHRHIMTAGELLLSLCKTFAVLEYERIYLKTLHFIQHTHI